LTADAMQAILAYDWPGNVRELRTAVEHGVVMATGPRITLRDLPGNVRQAAGGKTKTAIASAAQPYNLHDTERRQIERALAESNGNVTEAAKKLGISRRTLHRKLKSFKAAESLEPPPSEIPSDPPP
jgi:transcriptional regulator of acetoin/glycerol metabolism